MFRTNLTIIMLKTIFHEHANAIRDIRNLISLANENYHVVFQIYESDCALKVILPKM